MFSTTITLKNTSFLLMDVVALGWFCTCIILYKIYIEGFRRQPRHCILTVMNEYRLQWLRQMLKRDNRIADVNVTGNLMRSISFFASTSILIIAGLVTAVGYREKAVDLLNSIPFAIETTPMMWELKILLMVVIFTYAFFKFTWSLRSHNYLCILIGAAPLPNEEVENHDKYAKKLTTLSISASRHFNHGIRAYYFALATLSWFLHPIAFMIAMALIMGVIYRREFRSTALASLLS